MPNNKWKYDVSFMNQTLPISGTIGEIDAAYVPNPALARGATHVPIIKYRHNAQWFTCPEGTIMDTIMPDNSRVVEASDDSFVEWDSKKGSWMFIKKKQSHPTYKWTTATRYIKAARCFEIVPSMFSATTSCRGNLPDVSVTMRKRLGPVQKYGVENFCSYMGRFMFCPDTYEGISRETGVFPTMSRSTGGAYVTCVGGSWIFFEVAGGN